ncbi:hypothetical protein V1514DRAFT_324518 [Lipomyces japonicus]|uniref:uncharacterized protein n=1 Tax=Lipomyces japonicus TaxID=56871 RepID=UPI0034CED6FF
MSVTGSQAPEKTSGITRERKTLYKNLLLATTFAYLSAMIAKRSVLSRRYVPSLFEHNHKPPQFNKYNDAVKAVTIGTLLSTSFFGVGVTGVALVLDVHSAKEFNDYMKQAMGGHEKDLDRAKNIDPEVLKVEESINSFLSEQWDVEEQSKNN